MEDERIIKLLGDISNDLKKIASLLESRAPTASTDEWIDRLEVEKILRVSGSSVKRYTADGTFKACRIGQKAYYNKREIFEQRDKFLK